MRDAMGMRHPLGRPRLE